MLKISVELKSNCEDLIFLQLIYHKSDVELAGGVKVVFQRAVTEKSVFEGPIVQKTFVERSVKEKVVDGSVAEDTVILLLGLIDSYRRKQIFRFTYDKMPITKFFIYTWARKSSIC